MEMNLRSYLVFVLVALFAAPACAAGLTDLERQRLLAHMEMTESWIADEVEHLSPEQLKFRPSPTAWNALDCVEHLILAETEYWKMFQRTMSEPPSKKGSPSSDIDRMWYGIDRTNRDKTVESEVPKSRFTGAGPALAEFRAIRATMKEYVRTTHDDLRHHMVTDWNRDAYQWLLMVSAHSQRHILQIREIKHSSEFPASR